MKLGREHRLPLPRNSAWLALRDVTVLQACIPGCESLQAVSANEFEVRMTIPIGPFGMKSRGKIHLRDLEPSRSYILRFENSSGQSSGEARIYLESLGEDQTLLRYTAHITLGSGMLQFGSGLLDMVAHKLADDFFIAFAARVRNYTPT